MIKLRKLLGRSRPTILMVEDNETNHALFKDAFNSAGFTTIVSQNADDDFVNDVADIKPDIISMDLMIGKPDVEIENDGFAAIAMLKEDARTKHIPIIVLTSFFAEDKVERAKRLGAVDFLSLQGHAIKELPALFKTYLHNPKKYLPVHPSFRE